MDAAEFLKGKISLGDRERIRGALQERDTLRVGVASEFEPPEQNPRDIRVMIEEESWEEEGTARGNLR